MDGESALIIAKLLQDDLDGSNFWMSDNDESSSTDNTNHLIGELAEVEVHVDRTCVGMAHQSFPR